jgi:hypothetical protein
VKSFNLTIEEFGEFRGLEFTIGVAQGLNLSSASVRLDFRTRPTAPPVLTFLEGFGLTRNGPNRIRLDRQPIPLPVGAYHWELIVETDHRDPIIIPGVLSVTEAKFDPTHDPEAQSSNDGVEVLINETGETIDITVASIGPMGPAGPQGEQGIPGRDGEDGAPGRDGVDGKDGKDGRDGTSSRALTYVSSGGTSPSGGTGNGYFPGGW